MITFIVLAALMTLAAVVILCWPLLRASGAGKRWPGVALSATAVPVLAAVLYVVLSNWDWNAPTTAPGTAPEIEKMVQSLETRLRDEPGNVDGWLLLGRSYFELERYFKSADAYQQAYNLTQGRNVDAVIGLAESLAFADQNMLLGRSAELFEAAFALAPRNPKVLWYTGLVAYQSGRRAMARDRWADLVALEPPPEVKRILQDKIAEIEGELQGGSAPRASAPASASAPAAASSASAAGAANVASPVVRVRVTLAPALTAQSPANAPLFVLVRAGEGGGPPLAVQRRASSELPVLVELTDRDAMIAGRGITGAGPLTVVARIARSGEPTARSGDLEGSVRYDPGSSRPVELVIDRIVP